MPGVAIATVAHFPNLTGQNWPKAGQFKAMQGKKLSHLSTISLIFHFSF
jgi:hypothetical protein